MSSNRSCSASPEHLKLIASWRVVHEFEGLEGHPVAEQVYLEVKSVGCPGGIGDLERLELHVGEIDAARCCDFLVKTAVAEVAVAAFDRAVVHLTIWVIPRRAEPKTPRDMRSSPRKDCC